MPAGLTELSDGTVVGSRRGGDIAEYKAIVWLLDKGYEVFKNVGATGDVDLVVLKDSTFTKIDVKTVRYGRDGACFSWKSYLSKEQLEAGVKVLFVEGDKVGWNRDYF